eukprot:SAG31_NODE_1271_length_9064_cov_10.148912_8_plen_77_part_00
MPGAKSCATSFCVAARHVRWPWERGCIMEHMASTNEPLVASTGDRSGHRRRPPDQGISSLYRYFFEVQLSGLINVN